MITTRSISPSRAGRGRRTRGSRVRRAPTAKPEARSWRRVRAGSLMGRRIARVPGAQPGGRQPARARRTCAHARLRGADDVVQAHPPLARAPGRARTRRCPAAVEAVVERRDTRLLRAPERAPAALDCAAAVLPGLTARLHGDPTAAERGHAASWHVLLAAPQVDGHPLSPV